MARPGGTRRLANLAQSSISPHRSIHEYGRLGNRDHGTTSAPGALGAANARSEAGAPFTSLRAGGRGRGRRSSRGLARVAIVIAETCGRRPADWPAVAATRP